MSGWLVALISGCAPPEAGGRVGADETVPEVAHPPCASEPAPTDPTEPPEDEEEPEAPEVDPPLGATSGGSGGSEYPDGQAMVLGDVQWEIIAPSGSSSAAEVPVLLVYSGTEGAWVQRYNLWQVAPYFGLGDAIVAVLDGRYASAEDGAAVLDAVRGSYDVDNDRTWLLTESAGTSEGLALGLDLRQSYFAAVWANDVVASRAPAATADDLGFTPWGNAAPGGDLPDANAIVAGMEAAGYALPADAPYSGPGWDEHGSVDQYLAAVGFFADKRRE